jgi:hypothetical protein
MSHQLWNSAFSNIRMFVSLKNSYAESQSARWWYWEETLGGD